MPRGLHLAIIVALVAATGLSACGRRGDLEPPPSQVQPTADGKKPSDPGIEKPKGGFILDPLLN